MFGKSPFSSAPISGLFNQAYAKALSSAVSTIVSLTRQVNKVFSIISEYVIVVLSDLAFHLIGFSINVVASVSFKRAIAKTLTVLSTLALTLTKSVLRSFLVASTAMVTILRSIGKIITTTVTGIITLLKPRTVVKALTVTVTNTIIYIRNIFKTVSIVSTGTVSYIRFISKTFLLHISGYLQVVAEFVKRYGAVAKFTFIVQPKDRLVAVAHQTILVVQKAERSLSIIKSRIILIFKGDRNG